MSAWAPADWIALAGVAATALGALATLGGVRIGERVAMRATQRTDAETALTAVELARQALDTGSLFTQDLYDDYQKVDDSEARLLGIKNGDAIRLAHEAITALIVRRSESDVREVARELDARLSSAQQLVAIWYGRQLNVRQAAQETRAVEETKAAQSLKEAQKALDGLDTYAGKLRRVTLGESGAKFKTRFRSYVLPSRFSWASG